MTVSSDRSSCTWDIRRESDDTWKIRFIGRMDMYTAGTLLRELTPRLKREPMSRVEADLGNVTYMDDFGALVLCKIRQAPGVESFTLLNVRGKMEQLLCRIDFESQETYKPPKRHRILNLLIRLGDSTITELDQMRYMVSFVGSVVMAIVFTLIHPGTLRMDDTITQMEKTGVDAMPIVALISFLLGLIMAFMSSIQLRQFGAEIYVASLVGLAMVSELGPIMTAIVVAGRSGSAFGAEIGAMKISEEIDALFVMGFDPTRFIAVPRIIASMITVPILSMFSNLFAITGGLVVGVTILKLTPGGYIRQTLETLALSDILWGLFKSTVFGFIIALIGCLKGFQAHGGADSVGNAATSAVVSGIFFIILFDSIFAVVRSYWG